LFETTSIWRGREAEGDETLGEASDGPREHHGQGLEAVLQGAVQTAIASRGTAKKDHCRSEVTGGKTLGMKRRGFLARVIGLVLAPVGFGKLIQSRPITNLPPEDVVAAIQQWQKEVKEEYRRTLEEKVWS